MTQHADEHDREFSEAELRKVLDALAFQEIDHHGSIQSVKVHLLRKAIEPVLEELVFGLHDIRAVAAGEQWTIPVGLSCGFQAEVIIRVRSLGPDHAREEVTPDA
jgi:hypothetical protein